VTARRSDARVQRLTHADDPVAPAAVGVTGAHPVLVVGGSTQPLDADTAVDILAFLEVALDVAARHDAVVVTGATDAGVFHLLGRVLAHASAFPPAVVGVAPADLVVVPGEAGDDDDGRAPLEPHHTAFVLVPGDEWGTETATMSRLVDAIAAGSPVVALLVGGGDVAAAELDEHRRRGRRIVVLGGSGRLADDVAAAARDGDGTTVVDLGESAERLRVTLDAALGTRRQRTLRQRVAILAVWPRLRLRPAPPPPPLGIDAALRYPALASGIDDAQRIVYPAFAACDVAAGREQNRYRWFLVLAIIGGLLTTVFGALQTWLHSTPWPGVVVATLGAATSAVSTVARRQGSLDAFLAARLRAERLRSLYFEYVAEPQSADDAAREAAAQQLEAQVAEIRFGPIR
jgi:hypothetical protein